MGIFDAMGSAAGGMMGGGAKAAMGGGNGGSFAQKQMMKSNPVMQGGGMGQRMGMMRGQGPQMASTFGMQGPNKMRPTPEMPFGNQMRQGMQPGIGPRFQGQMGGMAQGMGQAIAPWMQQRKQMPQVPQGGTGPYMPEGGGGVAQPQVQGPNGESPSQRGGGGLMEMLRKMQMNQQQGQQGGGGYNTGIAGGMNRRFNIAPQMSMMPQQMQEPRQPNPYGAGYGEEEMY